MARKTIYGEKLVEAIATKYTKGTFDRIAHVLKGGENTAHFVREATLAEIRRRERRAKR